MSTPPQPRGCPRLAGSSEAGDAVGGGGRGPWRARRTGGAGRGGGNSEVSPLVIGGVMYLTTGGGRVAALEPETAKEIWTYNVTDGAPATRAWNTGRAIKTPRRRSSSERPRQADTR